MSYYQKLDKTSTTTSQDLYQLKDKQRVYNQPDHQIIETKENLLNSLFQYFDKFRSAKLQRLIIFFTFIITLFCLLLCLAKLCKQIKLVKSRHRKYGYFFHARYELTFYTWLISSKASLKNIKYLYEMSHQKIEKIYSKLLIRSVELTKEQQRPSQDKLDIGHDNKVFNNSEENLDNHEITFKITPENDGEPDIVIVQSWSKKSLKRLQNYLENKRTNSFKYIRVKTEAKVLSQETKCDKEVRGNLILKLIRKWLMTKNSDEGDKGTTTSSSSEDLLGTHFDLPTVLITDTTQMYTNVIDMDTFKPELNS